METKCNASKDFIIPVLVLVAICFATTFLLAFTYGVTSPIIAANTEAAASEARSALLEEAKGEFEESSADCIAYEEGKVYVENVFNAKNGSGMVVTVKSNSYGGLLTAMVGINKDGEVTGVQITEHADTPGVGTKAQAADHLAQYVDKAELGSDNIKAHADDVMEVTGAAVSSGAVHKAVYGALEQFKAMGGVK